MEKVGRFKTLRIQNAKSVESEEGVKIFGVRIPKFLPNGWVHMGENTPSKDLLFWAKNLEKNKEWNPETFKIYRSRFLEEIKKNPAAKNELREIISFLRSGKNVYYACYCGNPKICHRSIVLEIIEKLGFEVELN